MPTKSNHNGIVDFLRKQVAAIRRLLRTSRGRDILTYLLFLAISYGFWMIMRLNDTDQRDFDVPLRITNVPEKVTFISDVPGSIHVTVRDKGIDLLRAKWSGSKTLTLNYADFTFDEVKDRVTLNSQKLSTRVHDLYPGGSQIMAIRPDSLSFIVTNRRPSLAIVTPDVEVTTTSRTVISGPITVSPDSVKIYSTPHSPLPKLKLRTEKFIQSGISDTLRVKLEVLAPIGMRVEPSKVTVTIPVEPLMAKKRDVDVQLINTHGHKVVLFPAKVSVSYLLPMSMYNSSKSGDITVSADFSRRADSKIPVEISGAPKYFRALELATDSVEYLIEE